MNTQRYTKRTRKEETYSCNQPTATPTTLTTTNSVFSVKFS